MSAGRGSAGKRRREGARAEVVGRMDPRLQSWDWPGSSTWDALGGVTGSSDTCECNSELQPMPRDLFAMESPVSVINVVFTMTILQDEEREIIEWVKGGKDRRSERDLLDDCAIVQPTSF